VALLADFVGGDGHHGAVKNMMSTGPVWRLHHRGQEIAQLTVTGEDMPRIHADVETLPGFEEFRAVFAEQEQALDDEDYERADVLYDQISASLTMTFPDGRPVAEFLLRIHDDGTASWRWQAEPFDAAEQ
jgi:hypothetical protein